LRELLVAILKLARKGFQLVMYDLVRANIPSLGESLAADIAAIRLLASMSTFMRL
jgi:hypothetical protein